MSRPPTGTAAATHERADPDLGDAELPRLVLITDAPTATSAGHRLVDVVAASVAAGAPAVLVRDRHLPRDVRARLAGELAPVVHAAGAQLWLAGTDADLADALGAVRLHLAARDPLPHGGGARRFGRSTHDATEVARARDEGATHVTVSPVATSVSKTDDRRRPLGAAGFATLAARAEPVAAYALGGIRPDDVATWRAAGAAGVAVLGGIVAAADPGAATRRYLAAPAASDPDGPERR